MVEGVQGIEAINKHMGDDTTLKFKNDDGTIDKIKMARLEVESFGEFWHVLKQIPESKGGKPPTEQEILKSFDCDTMNLVGKLVKKSLKMANPEVDDKKLDRFASRHFLYLFGRLFEINVPTIEEFKKYDGIDVKSLVPDTGDNRKV